MEDVQNMQLLANLFDELLKLNILRNNLNSKNVPASVSTLKMKTSITSRGWSPLITIKRVI